jgi:hypothetical protein
VNSGSRWGISPLSAYVFIDIRSMIKEQTTSSQEIILCSENFHPVRNAEILGVERVAEAVGSGIYPKENRVYALFTEACQVSYSM